MSSSFLMMSLHYSKPRRRWPVTAVVMLLAMGMTACHRNTSGKWFEKPKTSRQWLDLALEAPTADERRRGVIGLARSQDARTDWAMNVFNTIARTDSDAMVRCAAVRAMTPAATAAQLPTLLALLGGPDPAYPEVRPTDGTVRWEAAKAINRIVDEYRYEEHQRPAIVRVLLDRAVRDTDRNVRLTVVETLAYFAEQPIPSVLIDVLEEEDFALQRAAETSLIALTGVTHQHDAKAWRQWLASTTDPFEKSGQLPDEYQSARKARASRFQWDF